MTKLKTVFKGIIDSLRAKQVIPNEAIAPIELSEKIDQYFPLESGSDVHAAIRKDVNFYRPDGVVLFSYTSDEVLAEDWTMPDIPASWIIRWTCNSGTQTIMMMPNGWNHSKDDVKLMARKYKACDVCAQYMPTDHKTRILIEISSERLTHGLYFKQTVSNGISVNWG